MCNACRKGQARCTTDTSNGWEEFDVALKEGLSQATDLTVLLGKTTNVRLDLRRGLKSLLLTISKMQMTMCADRRGENSKRDRKEKKTQT